MIHSVTLSPVNPGNFSTMLDGKYYDKKSGQTIYLLNNHGVMIDKAPTPGIGEQKWIQWFKPTSQTFTITWDDTKENGAKIAKFVGYLKRHSSVKCDGNDNIEAGAQFKLVDSRQVYVDGAKEIKNKLAVGELVLDMKASEMMSVGFLMGVNPINKTTPQIFNELCDFDMGKCMQNAAKFLADWSAPDRKHTVYARKAIDLGVITIENSVYKFNSQSIGGTIDEVVMYFKNNPDMYKNYIQKKVDESEVLPISVTDDITVREILDEKVKPAAPLNNRKTIEEKSNNRAEAEKAKTEMEQKRKELIAEAIRLGVKGAQLADRGGWSIEAIQKKIDAHKLANIEEKKVEEVTA